MSIGLRKIDTMKGIGSRTEEVFKVDLFDKRSMKSIVRFSQYVIPYDSHQVAGSDVVFTTCLAKRSVGHRFSSQIFKTWMTRKKSAGRNQSSTTVLSILASPKPLSFQCLDS